MSWRRGRHEHADRADAYAQYRLEFAPGQLAAANGSSPVIMLSLYQKQETGKLFLEI